MIVECVAIILVILTIGVVFLRTKRKDYALSVLPLLIVPTIHILTSDLKIAKCIALLFSTDTYIMVICIDIISLVLSCIMIGLFSQNFKSKTARHSYTIISAVFLIILVWVFSLNSISKISMI